MALTSLIVLEMTFDNSNNENLKTSKPLCIEFIAFHACSGEKRIDLIQANTAVIQMFFLLIDTEVHLAHRAF